MAHAIVSPALDPPRLDRQQGLGNVQGLDLALMINSEDQGAVGRVQAEADPVRNLGLQFRLGAVFDARRSVRFQALLPPDLEHRGRADHDPIGQLAAGSGSLPPQGLAQGAADDPAPARSVDLQAAQASLPAAGAPELHCAERRVDPSLNLPIGQTLAGHKRNATVTNQPLGERVGAGPSGQPRATFLRHVQREDRMVGPVMSMNVPQTMWTLCHPQGTGKSSRQLWWHPRSTIQPTIRELLEPDFWTACVDPREYNVAGLHIQLPAPRQRR